MALKGQELISFLQQNEGLDRDQIMQGAGYSCVRNGKTSIQRTKFFEALAAANGHSFGVAPQQDTGKEATYRLKVGPKGLIPVSRAYTVQCDDMLPGSYVKVSIEDGAIILEPDNQEPEGSQECPVGLPGRG